MKKTKFCSYQIGDLPKGCQLCVQGAKLVLFVTGLCPRCCYFCPISDKKYKKDVVYADEWQTKRIKDIIKEARLIDAKGAGLTGGDPLCRLDRAVLYIKALKKTFGKRFHIHLYTSLDLINGQNLKNLDMAGLDEIRFHLDLEDKTKWNKIKLALNFKWDVGIEVPVIPKKENELKQLIDFIEKVNKGKSQKNKIKFLNLNELEIADNKVNRLAIMGYRTKDEISYAIKGSEELGFAMLKYIEKKKFKLDIHYCTATLKDKVQLANRIKRRAKQVAQPYDIVGREGILTRGAIYLPELAPGFGYRKKIGAVKNKKILLQKLNKIKDGLIKDNRISKKLIGIDNNKFRILISAKLLKKIKINNKLIAAVVQEYPTYDQLELSIEFIKKKK